MQAKNLMNAKQQLATVSKDLEFIKDSITTTEVRRVPGSSPLFGRACDTTCIALCLTLSRARIVDVSLGFALQPCQPMCVVHDHVVWCCR